ncbi:MAG: hypothetical protein A2504_01920 [Bdellovibrionales bacterium RIFOXYD12_FULL_39_22]|nr:MAG: hypothetical protein A2385_04445 [Bdellovibrionales bacterium RIFOXYB1_FULL_39_21]OFZ42336.1 MAG: hypothetical protein A2485_15050 [Bdellovibrionales bacterium RIFOXYC12_FULL_39_17]OFZ46363.1 MAG: hypothetical protein A2404_13965 [Bdellovibrionales bacterium RIFOXYC1_FULL_39_130]OFZ72848.1 MAG: hypothetical protein A2451_10250 [Bdellovibrionales bacterium RIFOXYC2_FULL_39_8]OFZ75256.1 MAG: hypothetical protein A2560_16020 [Bdellovibrionales bacterium RIFOXYD1_FULL_39_84]OFZ93250.1 MAG:
MKIVWAMVYLSAIFSLKLWAQDSSSFLDNFRYLTSFESFIKFNKVSDKKPQLKSEGREEVRRLHQSLFIADLHADTLLYPRKFLTKTVRGHIDLPRMQAGNVALQVFAAVTKSPLDVFFSPDSVREQNDMAGILFYQQGMSKKKLPSLFERAKFQAKKLHYFANNSAQQFIIIKNKGDLWQLQAERKAGKVMAGGMLALEGLHAIEGDLTKLEELFDLGFRMASPTHFFDNKIGGSAHGINKGGLTTFGRQVIKKMEALQMIIDVAHASPDVIDEILMITKRPIILSHGGVDGYCHSGVRNISDQQIKAIAQSGGIIGIGLWEVAVCGTTAMSTAQSMKYIIDLLGNANHVALGSDFDGVVTTHFDVSHLEMITEALLDLGVSSLDIRKIMGENFLRLLHTTLPTP